MTGNSTELRLCDVYDWRSWASWRALLVTAAIIGVLCGVAGLAGESVVRDLFGMEFGRGSAGGSDYLALGIALAFSVAGIWTWHRVLGPDEDTASAGPHPSPRSSKRIFETSLALGWSVVAFTAFCVVYFGARFVLTDLSTGGVTYFVAVGGLLPALIFLTPKLRHFGAKPLSAGQTSTV